MERCWALLLAAGFGRRFGTDKRLQPLKHGKSVAQTTVENWLAACEPSSSTTTLAHLYVATRPDDAFAAELGGWSNTYPNAPLSLIQAPDAALGMGHTLANALSQIPAGPLVIGLADMPWVQPATLQAIAAAVVTHSDAGVIVQPSFRGKPGNPLGFGANQRAALVASSGDQGARPLVQAARRAGTLSELVVEDAGILLDIDTPADLDR